MIVLRMMVLIRSYEKKNDERRGKTLHKGKKTRNGRETLAYYSSDRRTGFFGMFELLTIVHFF